MKIEIINEFYTSTLREGAQLNTTNLPIHFIKFPGGEQHVRIDMEVFESQIRSGSTIMIWNEIRDSSDFMRLVMVKNALDNALKFIPHVSIRLVMLYVPYARQDRVCEPGEAFGLKAFADMLNALNFDMVTVADPHSEICGALINKLKIIPQEEIASKALSWRIKAFNMTLVSPDAGALKKIYKLAKMHGSPVVCATKLRDTSTGEILATTVPVEDFNGANLLIVDDICDGGRTFLELAKVLKERNAGRIELFVTHGIFSKGVDIFDGYIDTIHSLNVWDSNVFLQNTKNILVENQTTLKELVFI